MLKKPFLTFLFI